MGSIPPGSFIVQSVPQEDGTASPCSGWVRLLSRAAAGEATGMWPGGSLRDPPQSQYIKANVANPHGLVQIKLYNRNLLGRAFMAKKASAVAAVEAKQGGVRGPPAATVVPPAPHTRYSTGGEGSSSRAQPLGSWHSQAPTLLRAPATVASPARGCGKSMASCRERQKQGGTGEPPPLWRATLGSYQ